MTLTFSDTTFDAVICLNGDLPTGAEIEVIGHHPMIAADGAANTLVQAGIIPEFVVGDLDSVEEVTLSALHGIAELVHDHDQDTTDFEKALRFAERMMWKRLCIIGIHGGDFEHTLNNWSVLVRMGRSLHLTAYDRGRYAIPMYESFSYHALENELLSLVPQPHARITTSGLVWNITDDLLALGHREGARNRAQDAHVTVDMHEGSLLFFCTARMPFAPAVTVTSDVTSEAREQQP